MSTSTKTSAFSRGFRRTATALAGGAIIATGMAMTSTSAEAAGGWDQVAQCESGGNWSINTGNGFKGGLQFTDSTWAEFGGTQYASSADKASKSQQISVAEKVLAGQGAGAWPKCGKFLSGGADTSSAPSNDQGSSDSSQKSESSRSSDQKSNRSETRQAPKQETKKSEPQGDWSCDGDGIADNCTDNGFTKKSTNTHKKQQAPVQKQSSDSTPKHRATAGSQSVGNPDLKVDGTLKVDGKMGPKTITATQDWLGVPQTGKMDAETTKALQAWAGTAQDGEIGSKTVSGLEHEVGANKSGSDKIDGDTVEVLQSFLNLY